HLGLACPVIRGMLWLAELSETAEERTRFHVERTKEPLIYILIHPVRAATAGRVAKHGVHPLLQEGQHGLEILVELGAGCGSALARAIRLALEQDADLPVRRRVARLHPPDQ